MEVPYRYSLMCNLSENRSSMTQCYCLHKTSQETSCLKFIIINIVFLDTTSTACWFSSVELIMTRLVIMTVRLL